MKQKALIAMAVYDTEENGRTDLTKKTLESLEDTVNLNHHQLFLIDNASWRSTKDLLARFKERNIKVQILTNTENIGTAKAINMAWAKADHDQPLVKMDNDVVIHSDTWVEEMMEALERDANIGIVGLKRKDLEEAPWKTGWYQSILKMLPQQKGQRWIVVEKVDHVMGTCQMYSPALINKIGGLYQMEGLYGFDDALAAVRCKLAGFYSCFLPHIEIDHIDPGGTDYTNWKVKYANQMTEAYNEAKINMQGGSMPIFFPL